MLRGLGSDTVDLIYLDPPFNSHKSYAAPIGTEAEGQQFDDTWRWTALDVKWLGEIDRHNAALSTVIQAGRETQGDGTAAYLTMMGIRLLELQRILKPTGSIYLHCDDTANAYLRASMDAVFGSKNFRNDLTWRRFTAHNDAKRFGRITDTILFYVNGETATWNPITTQKTEEELEGAYPSKDARGRYRSSDLTGAGKSGGESGETWQGFNPSKYERHWSAPLTGRYAEWIDHNIIPDYRKIPSIHARLDALNNADMVLLPHAKRRWPGLKRYAEADTGHQLQSLILKPLGFTNYNKGSRKGDKYTGWKTQKPLDLIQPLIRAASNPGDLVLDPFCGCATACVAAEITGRQWIGIDACASAEEITRIRLADMALDWNDNLLYVTRTPPQPNAISDDVPRTDRRTRPYRTQENIDHLYGKQRGDCLGCGNHYRAKDMQVDHILSQNAGGDNDIQNLQLLCGHCNSTKSDGSMDDLWGRNVTNEVLTELAAEALKKKYSATHG